MSRRIFKKNKDSVSTKGFQFQASGIVGETQPANSLEADAELDAFDEDGQHQTTPNDPNQMGMGGGMNMGMGGGMNMGMGGGMNMGMPAGNQQFDVQSIINQAQDDASVMVNRARQSAAEIEREAYEKGLEEGKKTAQIAAEQQLQAMLNVYHNSLTQLDQVREIMLNQMQYDIMELVVHTAEKLMCTEIKTHPQVILNMLKDAIQGLKERKNLIIYLNQEDLQFLMEVSEVERQQWLGSQVQFEVDAGLGRGSFRVETPAGELDGSIESRLQKIQEELLQEIP